MKKKNIFSKGKEHVNGRENFYGMLFSAPLSILLTVRIRPGQTIMIDGKSSLLVKNTDINSGSPVDAYVWYCEDRKIFKETSCFLDRSGARKFCEIPLSEFYKFIELQNEDGDHLTNVYLGSLYLQDKSVVHF
jgi:hypothetical protein